MASPIIASETTPMTAQQILDREFLEIRAKLLEVAAAFDRLDRADGDISQDVRIAKIRESLQVLAGGDRDRAEQLQLIFSRQYEDDWQNAFDLSTR